MINPSHGIHPLAFLQLFWNNDRGGSPMKIQADLVVVRSSQLLSLKSAGPKSGAEMSDLGIIENGALAALGGQIVWVGSQDASSR